MQRAPNAAGTTAQAAPSAPIGFREEASGLGGSLLGVLMVLVVLLSVVCAGLWYAQRRGWLRPWAAPADAVPEGRMRVVQRVRLSPKTSVYRLRDGEQEYLIVESSAHVVVQAR